jgi:hypothetical protein
MRSRIDAKKLSFAEFANVSFNAYSYEQLFGRSSRSEPTLSTLLSSDILFELLPFSDSKHISTNANIPIPVPTTNFSSVAFLYRLPNFPDLLTQLQHKRTPQEYEYLQYLDSQLPLSDPECDLSSFERWIGNEVFEMQMTDDMLDEVVGGRLRGVISDDGDLEMEYAAGPIVLSL